VSEATAVDHAIIAPLRINPPFGIVIIGASCTRVITVTLRPNRVHLNCKPIAAGYFAARTQSAKFGQFRKVYQ
jgi:hypothetical protein